MLLNFLKASSCILCQANIQKSELCLCDDCCKDLPYRGNSCIQCGKPLQNNTLKLCGSCQKTKPPVDQTFGLFHYQSPVDYLIKRLKFENSLLPADTLGKLIAKTIIDQSIDLPELIIPVPLHTKRLRERGYNQALEIAKPLSKQLNIPLDTTSLIRSKHTRPQTECSGKERKKNIHNSFACSTPLKAKRVAILDDVITTGTTINEAARVLKLHGVKVVYAWSCAHA